MVVVPSKHVPISYRLEEIGDIHIYDFETTHKIIQCQMSLSAFIH